MEDDDGALVRRCRAGEADAWRSLVERFQGQVYGLCWRMLGQREDAEDVTQEVFVRALRHLDRWDGVRPLRPWLLAIAANRCRTRLSRRKTLPVPVEDPHAVAEPRRTSAPDLAEELQRGVEQLREDYRVCFVLFYQQELSVQEIAETLDCPIGTVKTWLRRARQTLAEHLRERQVVDEAGYELL